MRLAKLSKETHLHYTLDLKKKSNETNSDQILQLTFYLPLT